MPFSWWRPSAPTIRRCERRCSPCSATSTLPRCARPTCARPVAMATLHRVRWLAGSGKKSNQKRRTDRRRAMEKLHRASISRSEPAMVHTARHAVVVVAGIPAAAHAPGAPAHIIGVLVVGVARFVVGTGAGLGVGIGGVRVTLLREGRHCQRGIRGDGGNTEKRKFGHGYLLLVIPVKAESAIRKNGGRLFRCCSSQHQNTDPFVSTPNHRHHFRSSFAGIAGDKWRRTGRYDESSLAAARSN